MSVEWYYVDAKGAQQGPIGADEMKAAAAARRFGEASLVWNENLPNWIEARAVPEVAAMLAAAAPAPKPAAPQRMPVMGPGVAAAAAAARQAAAPRPAAQLQPQAVAPSTVAAASLAKRQHSQSRVNLPQVRPDAAPAAAAASVEDSAAAAEIVAAAAAAQQEEKKAAASEKRESNWKEFLTPEGMRYYHNTSTNETTWDKPDSLKSDSELDKKGDWFWVPEDSERAFVPCKRLQVFHDGRWEVETESGQRITVAAKQATTLEPLQWSQLRRLERDLVMLDVMNRPLIIYNLRNRFQENEIYTNVGTILVSVNPYKRLPLYTPAVIEKYRHRGNRQLDPHVFSIADEAFHSLIDSGKGQSIVISGESGAGKTECTKQCLQYLAEVAASDGVVEQKILLANPILEAFGNAKTVRNNNSSRFGKYVEIFFDGRGSICGATTTNYLLEKSRVVFQGKGERNYHIFYELTRGASPEQQRKYQLRAPETFQFLSLGTTQIDGQDDVEEFHNMESAMKMLEFQAAEVDAILQVVAGLLHLGDLRFKETGDRKCEIENKDALDRAATMLGLDRGALAGAVSSRVMRLKGQADITITMSSQEAVAARDAVAKFIYERMFDWLVQRINQSIGRGQGAQNGRSIGILDIFGFEIFARNSFEQLCINFANEKLQQFFNQHTFKLEEALYKQEQIRFVHVNYIDNQPVLDLIEQRPAGVLPMIDEELRIPKGSDKTYVTKLLDTHKANPYFSSVLKCPDDFIIKHYAGDVHYESAGFLEKNKDRLYEDAYALLTNSKLPFLKRLFPAEEAAEGGQRDLRQTLGFKFTGQLNNLMYTLNQTEPHYIRCIKPNPNKAPLQFFGNMVLEQLQYAGVFEAIQIRKSGYPFRLSHELFVKRFRCITPKRKFRDWKQGCMDLLREMKMSLDAVQIGVSKVLYRAEQHRMMELIRNVAVEKTVIFIQAWVRRFLAQKLLQRMKKVRPALQKALASCQRSRNIAEIDEAIKLAASISPFFVMKEVADLKWLRHVITEEQRVSKLLADLLRGDHEKNYEALSRAVASADEIGLQSAEANQAREVVAHIREKRAVAAALKAGVDEYDEDKLRVNLERAMQLGVQENVDKAYEMLEALIREKQYLYDAAIYQLSVLEEEAMQDIISRAEGIRYTTPEIERIRELLLNTPEEKFVQMQLKAAVANQDSARAVRVTIRLKDLFFAKQGHMFEFDNFGPLYDRLEWANQKLISFSREELAASMRVFSKEPIHCSLMQLEGEPAKLAKTCFKNILGFMGDRAYQSPLLLGSELVATALTSEGVRDEIYCQLVKQLTNNPNPESVRRGWQLMAVCLQCFPPGQFENYLEMFLRKNAPDKNAYVTYLHQTVYGGPVPTAPTEADIQRVVGGGVIRHFDANIRAEEKAAAKEALAFGGMGPQGAAGPRAPERPAAQPAALAMLNAQRPVMPSRPQMPPRGAPPPGPPPKKSPWQTAQHPETGETYWWNPQTNETSWDKPADA